MAFNYTSPSKASSTTKNNQRSSTARASILQEAVYLSVPLLIGFYSVVIFLQNLISTPSLQAIRPGAVAHPQPSETEISEGGFLCLDCGSTLSNASPSSSEDAPDADDGVYQWVFEEGEYSDFEDEGYYSDSS
ncbi:MAG: hypothetical protein Q9160_001921 [Pyrenula sp. 1 TL-2023]